MNIMHTAVCTQLAQSTRKAAGSNGKHITYAVYKLTYTGFVKLSGTLVHISAELHIQKHRRLLAW